MTGKPSLVVFDIDGTLLATDSFWLGIAATWIAQSPTTVAFSRRSGYP